MYIFNGVGGKCVIFQRMLDSSLEKFCLNLKPPAEYTKTCTRATREIFDLLLAKSLFPITCYKIGGGLPVAKNTSTCLKADSDCTIYVDWSKLNVFTLILIDKSQSSSSSGPHSVSRLDWETVSRITTYHPPHHHHAFSLGYNFLRYPMVTPVRNFTRQRKTTPPCF